MNSSISTDTAQRILEQARILDQVTQALQEAQDTLPAPSLHEISALRSGESFSAAVYMIGLVQRAIVYIEDAASDLRSGFEEGGLSCLDTLRPVAADVVAIETALNERWSRT